jgi:uncharacterized protein (DUF302 family)
MMELTQTLGFKLHLQTDLDTALALVTAALKAEGFGVLTRIDVRETLQQKLGVEFRPYLILGACNPALAHRALSAAPDVGLLLPCNVTLAAAEDGGTDVALVDPLAMLSVVADPALAPIAAEARDRLARVAAALPGASHAAL